MKRHIAKRHLAKKERRRLARNKARRRALVQNQHEAYRRGGNYS